ncbi:hypothetical protein K7X08_012489 [Anisodus acutangulus]|uniref:Uncharacterized protein n=1 Tax=Anisodus acutangulus TaxID=402998 RepID=A0A9Q1QX47_9SOLA|nr:hypothetical protein K7X08_012489 [Anisodus acutangulus]
MDSSGFFMNEVKSELNKFCTDNEDTKMKLEMRCHHGVKKCNFFEWRDDHVDQDLRGSSCIEAAMGMEGEIDCIDSEMVEAIQNSCDNESKQLENAINNE